MKKKQTREARNREMPFPVGLFISSAHGQLVLGPEQTGLSLPRGLDPHGPVLTYGPYLQAVSNFLCRDGARPLRTALSRHLHRPVGLREIESLEIVSQKHGAFYHVVQVRTRVGERVCSVAVNTAIHPPQQAVLESEFQLLKNINRRFPLGFIPRAYLMGTFPCATGDGPALMLKCFAVEWFEGFQEFHLSCREPGQVPGIRVWDECTEEPFLDDEEMRVLYHRAAAVLTSYLSPDSFSQIYPWHHAAGDFILKRQEGRLDVRLVTVRGYHPLVSAGHDPEEKWIPLVHFFLNLTLRMRLDRLDGTGDLVWANPDCILPVVSGFCDAWQKKAHWAGDLPSVSAVLDVLRSFDPEEWLSLAELILTDGLVELEEEGFIQPRLGEHVNSLYRAIR